MPAAVKTDPPGHVDEDDGMIDEENKKKKSENDVEKKETPCKKNNKAPPSTIKNIKQGSALKTIEAFYFYALSCTILLSAFFAASIVYTMENNYNFLHNDENEQFFADALKNDQKRKLKEVEVADEEDSSFDFLHGDEEDDEMTENIFLQEDEAEMMMPDEFAKFLEQEDDDHFEVMYQGELLAFLEHTEEEERNIGAPNLSQILGFFTDLLAIYEDDEFLKTQHQRIFDTVDFPEEDRRTWELIFEQIYSGNKKVLPFLRKVMEQDPSEWVSFLEAWLDQVDVDYVVNLAKEVEILLASGTPPLLELLLRSFEESGMFGLLFDVFQALTTKQGTVDPTFSMIQGVITQEYTLFRKREDVKKDLLNGWIFPNLRTAVAQVHCVHSLLKMKRDVVHNYIVLFKQSMKQHLEKMKAVFRRNISEDLAGEGPQSVYDSLKLDLVQQTEEDPFPDEMDFEQMMAPRPLTAHYPDELKQFNSFTDVISKGSHHSFLESFSYSTAFGDADSILSKSLRLKFQDILSPIISLKDKAQNIIAKSMFDSMFDDEESVFLPPTSFTEQDTQWPSSLQQIKTQLEWHDESGVLSSLLEAMVTAAGEQQEEGTEEGKKDEALEVIPDQEGEVVEDSPRSRFLEKKGAKPIYQDDGTDHNNPKTPGTPYNYWDNIHISPDNSAQTFQSISFALRSCSNDFDVKLSEKKFENVKAMIDDTTVLEDLVAALFNMNKNSDNVLLKEKAAIFVSFAKTWKCGLGAAIGILKGISPWMIERMLTSDKPAIEAVPAYQLIEAIEKNEEEEAKRISEAVQKNFGDGLLAQYVSIHLHLQHQQKHVLKTQLKERYLSMNNSLSLKKVLKEMFDEEVKFPEPLPTAVVDESYKEGKCADEYYSFR